MKKVVQAKIADALHTEFRIVCFQHETTMQKMLTELIKEFLKKQGRKK